MLIIIISTCLSNHSKQNLGHFIAECSNLCLDLNPEELICLIQVALSGTQALNDINAEDREEDRAGPSLDTPMANVFPPTAHKSSLGVSSHLTGYCFLWRHG